MEELEITIENFAEKESREKTKIYLNSKSLKVSYYLKDSQSKK